MSIVSDKIRYWRRKNWISAPARKYKGMFLRQCKAGGRECWYWRITDIPYGPVIDTCRTVAGAMRRVTTIIKEREHEG